MLNNRIYPKYWDIFSSLRSTCVWWSFLDILLLFPNKRNICRECSLEAPWQGASNEYPKHMFYRDINWDYPKTIIEYSSLTSLLLPYFFEIWKTKKKTNTIVLPVAVSRNCQMSATQCTPWPGAMYCGVWSGSTQFAQTCLSEFLE